MILKTTIRLFLLLDIFLLDITIAILVSIHFKKYSSVILDWSERYRALVDRFTNIISGQFFGHSHNDEIEIVRSYSDDSPVGVVFITPSLTTY